MIAILAKIIHSKSKEKNNNAIKLYINKHNQVPLWVLINFTDFGLTLRFYHCMKKSEQNKVAKVFSESISEIKNKKNILDSNKLFHILNNMREIRNVVAHNNKLLDFHCRNNLPYIKAFYDEYNMNPNDPRQDVFSIIMVMQIFMSEDSYKNFINGIKNRVKKLDRKLKSIECNKVILSLGIPSEWCK